MAYMAKRRTPDGPHAPAWHRILQLVLALLVVLLLGYLAVFSYHFAQLQLGPFAPLAAVLAAALLLAVVGPLLLVRYRHQLWAALGSGVRRLGALVAATRVPQRVARRFPRFSRWLVARCTPGRPAGLALSLWVAAALLFLEQVIELFLEVAIGTSVPALDRRIEHLVALIRTPELDHFFYAVTWLGSIRVVGVLALASALLALLARHQRDALLMLLATAASWLSAQGLQLMVARPRPPLADARVLETSFSFPSSHATLAAAFYGATAYFLIRALRRDAGKIVVGMLAGVLVLVVGVSRAYLGVHFPSDVLAGWMLGGLWLAVMVIADHLWLARQARAGGSDGARAAVGSPSHPRPPEAKRTAAVRRTLGAIDLLAAVAFAAIVVGLSAGTLPSPPQPPAVLPLVIAPDTVPQTIAQRLPHYTEGLTGVPQEPASFVFVGTQTQLEAAFRAAGWTEAARFSFRAVTGGVEAALTHHSDPAGPVTPSFLAEQPNALAFSLPVGVTFAARHHIRLWSTAVQTSSGQPLWLATASFDKGFELAPSTGLPTHQIDPDIDAERAFVVTSLQGSGLVLQTQTIQLVPPDSGRNFDGDSFHTDGQAVILYLAS